jgi:hypothetical protein
MVVVRMIIKAKFESICPECNGKIKVGDSVEWEKGSKAIHNQCKTKTVEEILAQARQENPKCTIEFIKEENGRYFFKKINPSGKINEYSTDKKGLNRINKTDLEKNEEIDQKIKELRDQYNKSNHPHVAESILEQINYLQLHKVKL